MEDSKTIYIPVNCSFRKTYNVVDEQLDDTVLSRFRSFIKEMAKSTGIEYTHEEVTNSVRNLLDAFGKNRQDVYEAIGPNGYIVILYDSRLNETIIRKTLESRVIT